MIVAYIKRVTPREGAAPEIVTTEIDIDLRGVVRVVKVVGGALISLLRR